MALVITETAKAKINLTLEVLGRRPDGYHELVSLVAFADAGDTIELDPNSPFGIAVDGPFASAIDGENLIAKTCRLVREAAPEARLGAVRLTKTLPVAAGLGGGSADAAAVLRAVLRAQPELQDKLDMTAIAAKLGADVTVCFAQRPAVMWGVGERIADVKGFPAFWIVLVNPGVPLSTADVFRALAAPPVNPKSLLVADRPPDIPGPFASIGEWVGEMRSVGNDLQATAHRLCPPIGAALAALESQADCLYAAQSGSGPTCFGVVAGEDQARAIALTLKAANPQWWTLAAQIT